MHTGLRKAGHTRVLQLAGAMESAVSATAKPLGKPKDANVRLAACVDDGIKWGPSLTAGTRLHISPAQPSVLHVQAGRTGTPTPPSNNAAPIVVAAQVRRWTTNSASVLTLILSFIRSARVPVGTACRLVALRNPSYARNPLCRSSQEIRMLQGHHRHRRIAATAYAIASYAVPYATSRVIAHVFEIAAMQAENKATTEIRRSNWLG